MATKVFISFDYDHDLDLKNALVGQSRFPDSSFEIVDWSIKEPSADWKQRARSRIRRADQVIVICGKHTDMAVGVNQEIQIAREESKPYFLLAGRADGGNKTPRSSLAGEKLYKWTWDVLKQLIGGAR